MKERPILFGAPMIRAILNGTKTQTRRPWKMPRGCGWYSDLGGEREGWFVDHGQPWWLHVTESRCPYGQPGDRLWVRETWAHGIHAMAAVRDQDGPFVYAATDRDEQRLGDRWRPSIHMPRAASRITLELTGVRVERLQDISEADALAEGIVRASGGFGLPAGEHFHATDPRQSYLSLWEAINGRGSVEVNPWVWVVEFTQIKVP